jgi:aryl-phospho-beta-D-glucosidase BglC (GH1 family)
MKKFGGSLMQNKFRFAKKALSTLMACTLTVSALGVPTLSSSVSAASVISADQITEEMGLGWNIGNSLDSTSSSTYTDITKYETAWGNPVVTQELIDTVKAKGFNTIRIPTTWYQHVTNNNGTYTIDSAWLERVKQVVDYAYNQGMYVILNIHHEEWINRSDFSTAYDEMSPELTQIWTQIATYFKDYDQHLIFEGMNEPRQTGSSLEWTGNEACYAVVNKLNNDFVNAVRAVDSPYQNTRMLMIPSYCASAYSSIYSYLEVPDDDYVAVSIHAYSPYDFAMGDGDHSTFTASNEAALDSLFKDMRSYFTDKDIPVVIGEFSASNYGYTDARCDWATYYMTWAKELGIPCVLWDNNVITNSGDASESHGYLNRSSNTWYDASEPVIDAMLSVLNDSSVVWDSEEHLPTYEHADLSTGDIIYEGSNTITEASSATAITTAQVSKGEIAIQYTGTTPVIAFMNSSWGNWTEVSPYTVDEEKGIAYYDSNDIAKAWGEDVSTISTVCVKVSSGECTYTKIVALGAATVSKETTATTTTTTTQSQETTTTSATAATTTQTSATTATQAPATTASSATTTSNSSTPSSGSSYTITDGTVYKYSEMDSDNRMIGFNYEDFGIGSDETISRVEVTISAIGSKIGTWQGAFGTSTTVDPDYWTMTDQMEQTFSGKTGTIAWDVDADTAAVIQTQYGGQVKIGFWWIDCDAFKIDSVTIYTGDVSSETSVTTTTSATTTTTTSTTTSTSSSTAAPATTTTTKASTTSTTATTTSAATPTTTTSAAPQTTTAEPKNTTTTSKTTTSTTTQTTQAVPTTYTVGDINLDNKISIKDVILLNKYLSKMVTLNDTQLLAADCYADGSVNMDDLTTLLRYLVDYVSALPVEA